MLRKLLAAGMISALFILAGFTAANAQSPKAGFHVTICHRTGSATNPYIVISPDAEGVIKGHLDHEQTGNGLGGDIIPDFIFDGVHYSKNLGTDFGNGITGAYVIAHGCQVPKIVPTPTPTPNGSPSPTPPPPPSPTPPAPVPEPMTILLFGTGLASIGMAARRKLFPKKESDE